MTTTPVLPSLPERTPTDYALALAEYMAIGADRLLDAINAEDVALERLGDPAERMTNEHVDEEAETARANRCELATGLRSDIYEFRKRRDRAIESLSSAPAEPTGWQMRTRFRDGEWSRWSECADLPRGEALEQTTGPLTMQFRPLYAHPTESAGPSSPMTLAEATREVGKWLNEEPNRPVDRHALAVMSAACQRLVDPTESAGPAPAEIRAAANALLHQIDIGSFVDEEGHSAKMLKATHDLMRLLGESHEG